MRATTCRTPNVSDCLGWSRGSGAENGNRHGQWPAGNDCSVTNVVRIL